MQIAILVVLCVVVFFAAKSTRSRVGRVSLSLAPAPPLPEPSDALLLTHEPPKQRPLNDARAIHLTSIKNRVYHFVGKSAVIRFERNESSGLWRVWIDAGTYDHAVIRATWKTEIGAWRLLLRAALSPEFGGPWMATK